MRSMLVLSIKVPRISLYIPLSNKEVGQDPVFWMMRSNQDDPEHHAYPVSVLFTCCLLIMPHHRKTYNLLFSHIIDSNQPRHSSCAHWK